MTLRLCIISVVVGMDAELSARKQTRDKIVLQSRVLLPAGGQNQIQSRVDKLNVILGPLDRETQLVVLRHGHANTIVVYFISMTLSAVTELRHQWRHQKLRDIVRKLFTFLSGVTRTVNVKKLTWFCTDYERCLEFFRCTQGNH